MSKCKELQDEERETLTSIYDGDEAFKQLNPITFQYKYGKDDEKKSFLVEIIWHDNYPEECPTINMDTFFNRNLIPAVKEKIKSSLIEESNNWLGYGMTYVLFECLKDRIDELVAEQPDNPITVQTDLVTSVDTLAIDDTINQNNINNSGASKKTKKEQLTKAQKRRQWERTDHKGEKPRGWNWIDIIKHLSQTGNKDDNNSSNRTTTNTANVTTNLFPDMTS